RRSFLEKVLDPVTYQVESHGVEVLAGQGDERQIGGDPPQCNGGIAAIGVGQCQVDQRNFEWLALDDLLGVLELSDAPNLIPVVEVAERFLEGCRSVDVVFE